MSTLIAVAELFEENWFRRVGRCLNPGSREAEGHFVAFRPALKSATWNR